MLVKIIIACLLVCFTACTASKNPLFKKKSPHEAYSVAISDAGLRKTQLGTAWFNAAARSLQQPSVITLPYKETGYFAAENPNAAGYIFSAKRGEKIIVAVNTLPTAGFLLFTEIWQQADNGSVGNLLTTMDTLSRQLVLTVKKDTRYLMRMQPELLSSVEYTISITTAPALAFPVDKSGNPKMISFWGVPRDGGARKHEGIDISAPMRTPALAVADGFVSRIREDEVGGKVVFLTDKEFGYSFYYAHLDEQLVRSGEQVKAGQPVGLVGKTGNAINTIPHLHFGIYTNDGAIDPLVFIDPKRSDAKNITAPAKLLRSWARTTSSVNIMDGPSLKNAVLFNAKNGDAVYVESLTDNWCKIRLPGGLRGFIPAASITQKNFLKITATSDTRLLDAPGISAAAKVVVPAGSILDIVGNYFEFSLVTYKNSTGWLPRKL